jgi:integrase
MLHYFALFLHLELRYIRGNGEEQFVAHNLTTLVVERAKPRAAPYELRDAKAPGLILRIEPGGTKTFYCEAERGKRQKIGRTNQIGLQVARDTVSEIVSRTRLGDDVIGKRQRQRTSPTLATFIADDYSSYAHAKQQDPQGSIARLNTAFASFASLKLSALTRLDLERWRAMRRKQGISTATINRDINCLRAALNQAVNFGHIDANPIAKIAMVSVDPIARVRFLSNDEERRLRDSLTARNKRKRDQRISGNAWRLKRGRASLVELAVDQLPDYLEPLILVAMNTGLRRGELFNLKWSDVNMENADLTVAAEGAKSRRVRHVPLNREAQKVFGDWRASSVSRTFVFASPSGERLTTVKTAWLALLRHAQIVDFRFHDLRHHFASRLVMEGVSLATVRELLGHADYAMTLRYAHLERKQRKEAVDVLGRARDQGELLLS